MDAKQIFVATVTLSDTRKPEDDEGGKLLRELIQQGGFELASHAIVREEPEAIRAHVEKLVDDAEVHAIVLTGGTGIAPRDRTIESITPLFDKTLDGFGEAFRRLSWDEIGARSILSRAVAGTSRTKLIFALPGSPKAVRLAVQKLIWEILPHAVALASGSETHHHHRSLDRAEKGTGMATGMAQGEGH